MDILWEDLKNVLGLKAGRFFMTSTLRGDLSPLKNTSGTWKGRPRFTAINKSPSEKSFGFPAKWLEGTQSHTFSTGAITDIHAILLCERIAVVMLIHIVEHSPAWLAVVVIVWSNTHLRVREGLNRYDDREREQFYQFFNFLLSNDDGWKEHTWTSWRVEWPWATPAWLDSTTMESPFSTRDSNFILTSG